MPDNEIFRTIKPIAKNKIILISFLILFLFFHGYNMIQIISLLFGSYFIVIALGIFYINVKKSKNWIETLGEVVDVKWYDKAFNGGYTIRHGQEVISYFTNSSKKHTVTNNFSNKKPKKQGQKIKIFYNPSDEKDILVYDFSICI